MGHNVTLKPSGHSFEAKEGQNILQAGLDAGFMMPYSCRTGVCRTCRGTIKEGKVDYGMVHPTYLPESDKAKGYALLCQAQPLSDLRDRGARARGHGRHPPAHDPVPRSRSSTSPRPTSRSWACACR